MYTRAYIYMYMYGHLYSTLLCTYILLLLLLWFFLNHYGTGVQLKWCWRLDDAIRTNCCSAAPWQRHYCCWLLWPMCFGGRKLPNNNRRPCNTAWNSFQKNCSSCAYLKILKYSHGAIGVPTFIMLWLLRSDCKTLYSIFTYIKTKELFCLRTRHKQFQIY